MRELRDESVDSSRQRTNLRCVKRKLPTNYPVLSTVTPQRTPTRVEPQRYHVQLLI